MINGQKSGRRNAADRRSDKRRKSFRGKYRMAEENKDTAKNKELLDLWLKAMEKNPMFILKHYHHEPGEDYPIDEEIAALQKVANGQELTSEECEKFFKNRERTDLDLDKKYLDPKVNG